MIVGKIISIQRTFAVSPSALRTLGAPLRLFFPSKFVPLAIGQRDMLHIIYMSSALEPFSTADLQALLATSRSNNTALGVTGLLLYKDGHFLQVIEGDQDIVEKLFAKICRDPRHGNILTLFKEPIPAREFPDWSMAFRDLSLPSNDYPEGFNDLLNANWADRSLFPKKVRAFMKMFLD